MKSILLTAVSAACLTACAASGPQTAWGKTGVTTVDYVTDLGTCTAMAAMTQGGNAANSAGGISGRNSTAPTQGASGSASASAGANQSSGSNTPTVGGGGTYRDSAPPDVVNRAANQQQSQEMAAARMRTEALRSCFIERGYQEFKLSPEQRAHLKTLKPGTNEYLKYLAEIGAAPKTGS